MPRQIGLVTRTLPKGLTEVLTERKGACSGCQPAHGCGTCLSSSKIKATAHNPIGAHPGDLVEIHMANKAIYLSALILYGLPLLGLIIGAATGASLSPNGSMGAALSGLGGIGAGLGLAVIIGRSDYAMQRLTPTITQVVKPVTPTQVPPKT